MMLLNMFILIHGVISVPVVKSCYKDCFMSCIMRQIMYTTSTQSDLRYFCLLIK